VRRLLLFVFLGGFGLTLSAIEARSEGLAASRSRFYYQTPQGFTGSARIIHHYWSMPIVHPDASVDSRLDPRLRRAATINSYPKTNYASEAGEELVRSYGFKRLPVHDQFAAPLGSVLVFGHGSAGHVVIRTKTGFVSDYWTKNRCKYPLVAVYGKFSS
jgi:hypothetical protein